MIIRMQQRRGTSVDWTSSNPILAGGEFGVETDTGKFKVGNGISNWSALPYFTDLNAIKSIIINSAPEALDTLNELAAALNDDANFATTINNALSAKAPKASPTFTGTVDFSGATVSGVMLPIEWRGTFSDLETYLENDMVHYNGSVYYAVGPNLNNAQGYFPTAPGANWELFAAKGDTGAPGATGATGPAGPMATQTSQLSQSVITVSSGFTTITPNSSYVNSIISIETEDPVTFNIGTGLNSIMQNGQYMTFVLNMPSSPGLGLPQFVANGVTLRSFENRYFLSGSGATAQITKLSNNNYILTGRLG